MTDDRPPKRPPIPELPPFGLGYPHTDLRRKLEEAVLRGDKIATAGLASKFAPHTDEPLPKTGDRWMMLGYDEEPVAVVETTRAEVVPAGQVSLQFARDEGEGFESVAAWREAHERFFEAYPFDDDTQVVCERFKLVRTL